MLNRSRSTLSRRPGGVERQGWVPMSSSSSSSSSSVIVLLVGLVALCLSATADAQPVANSPRYNYAVRGLVTNSGDGRGGVIAGENIHDGGGGDVGGLASAVVRHLSKRQQPPRTNDRPPGPAPGTSIALIILYSITGIITVLFLMILVTGAIRAHRHPERYGPRAIARFGQPRQSRAKGLARAVLDTIPVVRFGAATPDPVDPKPGGLELRDGTSVPATPMSASPPPPHIGDTAAVVEAVAGIAPAEGVDGAAAPETTGITSGTATPPLPSTPSTPVPPADKPLATQSQCPVCMEDFEQDTEVRVLPCGHSYHLDCIDPWLLNVSGSCPLCRIDLHPEGEEAADAAADAETLATPPPVPHRCTSRLAQYLHVSRRTSAGERMAALRQDREERNRQNHTGRSRVPELGNSRFSRVFARRMQSDAPPPPPPPPPPQLTTPQGSST